MVLFQTQENKHLEILEQIVVFVIMAEKLVLVQFNYLILVKVQDFLVTYQQVVIQTQMVMVIFNMQFLVLIFQSIQKI